MHAQTLRGLTARLTFALVSVLALVLSGTEIADAIPVFARQYRVSCNMCHEPAPKLNSFGREFMNNGFQLKGLEAPGAFVPTGDTALELPRELPLAVRLDGYARLLPNNGIKADLEWPFIMKLFSSGQIKEDISYFFYFLMNEGGEITGVEDAFLYFNDIAGQKLDITVGQFQVADLIIERELRPTFEDYYVYEMKPGLSKADLTYDRGLILSYAFPSATSISVGVLNGNGIGAASGGLYDTDPYKNFVGRMEQPFGESLKLGTLGYLGKELNTSETNDISMIGGDATIRSENFELFGQYLYRHDTNPYFVQGDGAAVNSFGGLVQLMYAPDLKESTWYVFLLYNDVRSGDAGLPYQSIAGNFSYLLSRNFKLTAEYGFDIDRSRHGFTFGFMTAF